MSLRHRMRGLQHALVFCSLFFDACNGDRGRHPLLGLSCLADGACGADLVCAADPNDDQADLSRAQLACQPTGRGDARESDCLEPAECSHGLCLLAGRCTVPCELAADCQTAERCMEVLVRTHARDALQRVSACIPRTTLGEQFEAERVLRAAAVQGGALGDETDTLEIPGTDRPTVYVLEHEQDRMWPESVRCRPPLCPIELTDGNGELLFDGSAPPTGDARVPIADLDSAFPMTVYAGNDPDFNPDGGDYVLTVQSEQPGDVSITRVRAINLAHEPDSGGQLDLNIFYLAGAELSATGARGPAALEAALEVVDEIFAQAGIFVGEVRQMDVPGELPEVGTTFKETEPGAGFRVLERRFGVWPELPGLLALSAGAPPGVSLFLVSTIDGMGTGAVRALAGGTPGPLGMHGTGASGIAVATADLLQDPDALGRTLAHEIAHYLGLFHTSEQNGDVLDPLSDTKACTLEQDTDGDRRLSLAECRDHGDDNLMFWSTGAGTALSPQQARVLRQAMVLK